MTITPVQTDINSFWEGLSTLEMIQEVRKWLGVSPTDTMRYSDAAVVRGLNYGQNMFASRTKFLLMPTVIICKANQMHYRVPYNTLKIIAARYYTGPTNNDYYELEIIRDMRQMQRRDELFRGNTGQPDALFQSYQAGNVKAFGLYPMPSIDGVIWVGSDYGLLTSATGFTNVGNITGMHKAGFAASAFLVDALGRDLSVLGAMVGYPIINVTDGSSGVITAIGDQDATNDKVSGTLAGGTNNYWTPGDSFLCPMSEYGVVIDSGNQETYMFPSSLGLVANIAGNTGNVILDIARKPLALSTSYQTMASEIPSDYQEAPIAYAVYWLGRAAYKGVVQEAKAAQALEVFEGNVQRFLQEGNLGEITFDAVETMDWWS